MSWNDLVGSRIAGSAFMPRALAQAPKCVNAAAQHIRDTLGVIAHRNCPNVRFS